MNIIELSYLTMFYACERFNCHKCLPQRGEEFDENSEFMKIEWNFLHIQIHPMLCSPISVFLPFSSFFHYYRSLARALCPPLSLSLYFSPSLYSFAFIYFAPATNLLPPVSAFVPHSLYFSSSPTHSAQLSSNIHKLFESLPISLSCAKLT